MSKIYILHGWSQENNKAKWQPFINKLRQNRIDTEFLNIPGLDSKLEKIWTLNDYVEWLYSKLPQNQKVNLLGHSFGGQISLLFTSIYKDKVENLILIDSAGLKDISLKKKIKKLLFYFLAKTGKLISHHQNFKKLLYKFAQVHDYEKANGVLKQTLINAINHDISSCLPAIECPTLIIWGENDKVTPIIMGNSFNQSIKSSKLHLIKEAKHSPQFTHVEKVSALITKFIQS